ncbi:unnamed protein product [Dicrocoelium dendriticum]|nr:unnamed protein product [Dicrocoelium dendriticum]
MKVRWAGPAKPGGFNGRSPAVRRASEEPGGIYIHAEPPVLRRANARERWGGHGRRPGPDAQPERGLNGAHPRIIDPVDGDARDRTAPRTTHGRNPELTERRSGKGVDARTRSRYRTTTGTNPPRNARAGKQDGRATPRQRDESATTRY